MAGTTWPSLIAGRKAKATEVEAKFDWLEGSLVPMLSGSTTDLTYDLGTSTARWRGLWVGGINPTTTAGGVAVGTTTVANASVGLELAGTTKAILVSRMTTAQRDALTAVNGMVIYNSDDAVFNIYENGAWTGMGAKMGIMAAFSTSTTSGVTATATITGSGRIASLFIVGNGGGVTHTVIVDSVTTGDLNGTTTGMYLARESGQTASAIKMAVGTNTADIYFKNQIKIHYYSFGGFTTSLAMIYEKS